MERFPAASGDPGAGVALAAPHSCAGRTRQPAPRRLPASRRARHIVGPDDRRPTSHPERSARPARAESRPQPGNTKRRQRLISEPGTPSAELAGQRPGSGPEHETPAAVTAATTKTPLHITCPRRSPGPAAFTAKTPKFGLEITSVRSGMSSSSGAFLVLVNEF